MSWLFGKKKEDRMSELPELPPLPSLPDFPESSELPHKPREELQPLPSFPSSITGERISNAAVKHAINNEPEFREEEEQHILPEFPREQLTRELDEAKIPAQKILVRETKNRLLPEKIEPIYVRIDKYQNSLASFQDIKKRILEIENLLRDIKELKAKEDGELTSWESEIQQTKSKLDSIDKALFGKLE